MRQVAIVLLCTLTACSLGWGQFQFGSVAGLVKDTSQAATEDSGVTHDQSASSLMDFNGCIHGETLTQSRPQAK